MSKNYQKQELEKAYLPQKAEPAIYQHWEKSGYFNPDKLPGVRKKPFCISMPPPNVTGELHLGHATALTIEDLLARYHRMKGEKVLYLPGTDHAGIATQIVVERLIKSEGLNRHRLGRKQFIKRVWAWKKKYGTKITSQIRQLGVSCDWSREHFTMDKDLTLAVQTAFIKMYNNGLIYRGHRIVNWCPRCSSALSDLEVRHQQTKGKLWYVRYPLFGSTKYMVVATTRPETMPGDAAIAVNPKDKRYSKCLGQTAILPIINREIPIIADRRVDIKFGTGAVKITPAHDHLDYEIGQDHHLNIINVIDQNNKMTKQAGLFFGKSVQEARQEIITKLEQEGLLEKIEDYSHNLARCDRCGTPIEPLISEQWFVKINKLAKPAIKAVKQGKIKIYPKRYEKTYFHWLENIKDWCISRQLWWGHQIPVWYKGKKIKASAKKPAGRGWRQDNDTLDTWFSSGLWTFSTLGWPKKTEDFKNYHPTDVMDTGWDILFFWVARMIMMSLYLTKKIPFKKIYLHGLVLDKNGKKMSKSKGTGVDPIPMTEKYGTDAIRLSLTLGTSAGQDLRLYEEKIAGYRNFINKLWNTARYILQQDDKNGKKIKLGSLADQWIISRLQKLIKEVSQNLEQLKFSQAGTRIYNFLWHELADWYLEISKVQKNPLLLHHILEQLLKISHPFMPFVTEEIWSRWRGNNKKNMLIIQTWPKLDKKFINSQAEIKFKKIQEFIVKIRNFRAKYKIPNQHKLKVYYWGNNLILFKENNIIIQKLANLQQLLPQKKEKITGTIEGIEFFVDYQASQKAKKLEIKKLEEYIKKIEQKLDNKNFISKAPQTIVNQERKKLREQKNKLKKLLE